MRTNFDHMTFLAVAFMVMSTSVEKYNSIFFLVNNVGQLSLTFPNITKERLEQGVSKLLL